MTRTSQFIFFLFSNTNFLFLQKDLHLLIAHCITQPGHSIVVAIVKHISKILMFNQIWITLTFRVSGLEILIPDWSSFLSQSIVMILHNQFYMSYNSYALYVKTTFYIYYPISQQMVFQMNVRIRFLILLLNLFVNSNLFHFWMWRKNSISWMPHIIFFVQLNPELYQAFHILFSIWTDVIAANIGLFLSLPITGP